MSKMADFKIRPLDEKTWPDFARLVEKHNGVWGGCWCLWFHQKGTGSMSGNKKLKQSLVCEGRARAALVYDGPNAIGWCQFGRPEDLPRIKHKKTYAEAVREKPDWRITCFFVDRDYRGRGVASIALQGALDLIAGQGGGLVESFPALMDGRKTSASFLYNSTVSAFEKLGFTREHQIGMHHWLVTKRVVGKAVR